MASPVQEDCLEGLGLPGPEHRGAADQSAPAFNPETEVIRAVALESSPHLMRGLGSHGHFLSVATQLYRNTNTLSCIVKKNAERFSFKVA